MKPKKVNFTVKGLQRGRVIELAPAWDAKFGLKIEAHDWKDTEPYMVGVVTVELRRYEKTVAFFEADSEGIIFPKVVPAELREPLMKLINLAIDTVEDDEDGILDDLWATMRKKGTWPPPKEQWIAKGDINEEIEE